MRVISIAPLIAAAVQRSLANSSLGELPPVSPLKRSSACRRPLASFGSKLYRLSSL
jgi:hypothetical protein